MPKPAMNVQCGRCRYIHPENERANVPSKEFPGSEDQVCPRCGAHSCYMVLKEPINGRHRANSYDEWRESYA